MMYQENKSGFTTLVQHHCPDANDSTPVATLYFNHIPMGSRLMLAGHVMKESEWWICLAPVQDSVRQSQEAYSHTEAEKKVVVI